MNITLICVGKLKERYWEEAVAEYGKRLTKYCSFSIMEVKEEKLPDEASAKEEEAGKMAEGDRILKGIKPSAYVIALEIQGKALDSVLFAEKLESLGLEGKSDIIFVIGGSNGLSKEVFDRADFRLSFSNLTFPHQMMRVVLMEQIYRAFKIIKKEPYHK